MSRYIDADLLLAQCRRNPLFEKTEKDKGMMYIERSIIDDTPTADVEEVRHGEWTKSNPYNRFMNCSVCGFGQDHTTFKYCPNCGAKMDGERKN